MKYYIKKYYLASKALNPGLSQPKHSNSNNCGLHKIPIFEGIPFPLKHLILLNEAWYNSASVDTPNMMTRECPQNMLWALHSPHFSDEVNCQPSLGRAGHNVNIRHLNILSIGGGIHKSRFVPSTHFLCLKIFNFCGCPSEKGLNKLAVSPFRGTLYTLSNPDPVFLKNEIWIFLK